MTDPLRNFKCLVSGHVFVPHHSPQRGWYVECFHCGRREYAHRSNVA